MVDLEKYGPWALITGASSGLGEHFARQLAALGFNLVLTARRKERLEALAGELVEKHGVETRCIPLDLAADGSVDELVDSVGDLDIGLLINNAGFGYFGSFRDQDRDRLVEMIHLNCLAVMLLAHYFANRLAKRGRGGILIVASLAGFQATPYMSAYGATKGFDLLFGEGIGRELKGSGVDVLVLNPGATHTEFGEVAGSSGSGLSMRPEKVTAEALRALGRKPSVIAGIQNRAVAMLGRILPRRTITSLSAYTLRKMTSEERR